MHHSRNECQTVRVWQVRRLLQRGAVRLELIGARLETVQHKVAALVPIFVAHLGVYCKRVERFKPGLALPPSTQNYHVQICEVFSKAS